MDQRIIYTAGFTQFLIDGGDDRSLTLLLSSRSIQGQHATNILLYWDMEKGRDQHIDIFYFFFICEEMRGLLCWLVQPATLK